ncbi:hypothetical protein E2493_19020 [Sphingomonas parva]|uniref:PDZ domain-containing protein n=1 Tax=Sphingomonas parva TaxID=2555898 RepID=A0A4Y8ZNA9_9SPHN|nr:hypothetical protein [Sphingomonas parva]TFI56645.1 hypothetical protein E2493_19020 [Sphingomonas parva]
MAGRFRSGLPERVPDFGRGAVWAFRLVWIAAFLLAIAGPVAGTWQRLSAPAQNSALVPGSRAGLALGEDDLTRIRFPVGPAAAAAGVRAGDELVAIDGIALSARVPMPSADGPLPPGTTEADYALLGEILYGTESRPIVLTLAGADGRRRDVTVTTGEQHIEKAAAGLGLPAWLLSLVDLVHLPTYPFLLASAWFLWRRREEDVVSSIVSLAILLTMAAEQPSASFFAAAGLPEWAHRILYDLGNILLLGGIMLFPFGRLRPLWVLVLIAALPSLLFVSGNVYRILFIALMALAVDTLFRRLRRAPQNDERQQLKWALFGFAGYAMLIGAALTADMLKLDVGSFGGQLALEVTAGFAFGLGFLLLQLGLLVALVKYRLYDAEAVISRSISIALITVILGAAFAGVMEGVKEIILRGFGQNAGSIAPIVGTAVSTILVAPVYERVQGWTERRFHRKLVDLREGLAGCLRDIRHFAPLSDVVREVLDRVEAGVRPRRLALVVEGKVIEARGIDDASVSAWLATESPAPAGALDFVPADKTFSIRLPLRPEEGPLLGWLLVGARPDRSCLSTAERDALIEIVDPTARAVRLVLKREDREQDLAATLAGLQRQIDTLTDRLRIDRAGTAA